jgi:PhnB protein
MTTVNVYLTFDGNCEGAFNFYKSVLGGEFSSLNRFSEMPPDPNYPVPDADKDKLMHISLPVSKETAIMGSDAPLGFGAPLVKGNNFTLSLNPDSREEADRIFGGLSQGGKVGQEMAEMFWGSYFGMFVDKFGVNWMVNFDISGGQ